MNSMYQGMVSTRQQHKIIQKHLSLFTPRKYLEAKIYSLFYNSKKLITCCHFSCQKTSPWHIRQATWIQIFMMGVLLLPANAPMWLASSPMQETQHLLRIYHSLYIQEI